ncbi:hypothetical protein EOJ36_08660 [Sandaracinomonas limnophila]|uniref:Uncharacterized protein n=1 Tax=Sandaracinomonas limnophila TaxID=1862386 RepID=A0A437PS51_9BACT|nr:hypothetical protein [Sandaracinomonas limnophila]RVU25066.1 hypothetical protein EOJ36_08660 [Sandaracinomonas limnophila]
MKNFSYILHFTSYFKSFTLSLILYTLSFIPYPLTSQIKKIPLNIQSSFRALKVSGGHLWAGGTKGIILHFEKDLDNPQVIHVPGAEKLDFRDLAILPNQQVLAMSAGPSEQGAAVIYYSNDLGKTWLKVFEIKEPGYFFDAIVYDEKSNKGFLLSDPIQQQLTLFEFNLNLEFQQVKIDKSPKMLPKEAFFAASGSSMIIRDGKILLVTGGSEKARIWQSKNLQANEWEIISEVDSVGANRGFFSINCGDKNCMVAGGDYTKLQVNEVPVLLGERGKFQPMNASPGFYIEKVLAVGKDWYAAGPAGLSKYSHKTKKWTKVSDVALHNIVRYGNGLVGIGKEVMSYEL